MNRIQSPAADVTPSEIADRFAGARRLTVDLISSLSEEDCCVQSQTCCSPVKWHLGHTTWFFERFVLRDALGVSPYDDRFEFLFNSYYNTIGARHPRDQRGLLTRPGLGEILAFRDVVDEQVERAIRAGRLTDEQLRVVELGLNHEQQHQELMLMDIKHLFSCSPLDIAFSAAGDCDPPVASLLGWVPFEGGVRTLGADFGSDPRVFDNEGPEHRVFLEPFELSDRLVTNGEYLEFVLDGGYERSEHWLDLGWRVVSTAGWSEPLYWEERDGQWTEFTLHGRTSLDPHAPVSHISYFEADAYARWAGARLPTEFELEAAWNAGVDDGVVLEDMRLHPACAPSGASGVRQLRGDLWEWTSSSYGPYPGYAPPEGAVGEYNGKFMCNQYVLRGGCCVTPRRHVRATYRNFFEPEARWQFAGIRLARSP